MKKFLIPHDMWHGVFPALVMILSLALIPLKTGHSQLTFLLIWYISSVNLWMLQGVNESWQSISKNVVKNYGSYENFQSNSKNDWKWFIGGWVGGSFIGAILFSIVDKL